MKLPKISVSLCILSGLFLIVPVLHACVPSRVSYAEVTPLKPESMVIFASMTRDYNGRYGKLNIYTDVKGFPNSLTPTPSSIEEANELMATLWLVIVSRPETFSFFRVKTGQIIDFEGYRIEILRIAEYSRGIYYVEVEVTES